MNFQLFNAGKLSFRPGDVIVDSISCLPVLDPLSNENAGGGPDLFTRAQHAVTLTLPFIETALVHLATGIPGQNQRGMNAAPQRAARFRKRLLQSKPSFRLMNYLPLVKSQQKTVHWLVLAETMDLAISPLSLVAVGLIQPFVRHHTLPIASREITSVQECCSNSFNFTG